MKYNSGESTNPSNNPSPGPCQPSVDYTAGVFNRPGPVGWVLVWTIPEPTNNLEQEKEETTVEAAESPPDNESWLVPAPDADLPESGVVWYAGEDPGEPVSMEDLSSDSAFLHKRKEILVACLLRETQFDYDGLSPLGAHCIKQLVVWIESQSGRLDLRGADLSDANLCGADLTGANLYGANLNGANLDWASLREADLRGAYLSGAELSWANLTGADLRGASLCGAELHEATLTGANLNGADLRIAKLRWADFTGSDLREADLYGADLREADLRQANLKQANLTGADLREADLTFADLTGVIGCYID